MFFFFFLTVKWLCLWERCYTNETLLLLLSKHKSQSELLLFTVIILQRHWTYRLTAQSSSRYLTGKSLKSAINSEYWKLFMTHLTPFSAVTPPTVLLEHKSHISSYITECKGLRTWSVYDCVSQCDVLFSLHNLTEDHHLLLQCDQKMSRDG